MRGALGAGLAIGCANIPPTFIGDKGSIGSAAAAGGWSP